MAKDLFLYQPVTFNYARSFETTQVYFAHLLLLRIASKVDPISPVEAVSQGEDLWLELC